MPYWQVIVQLCASNTQAMNKPIVQFAPLFAALSIAAAPGQANAQEAADAPQLSLEQLTAMRCSAAFAIVAVRQAQGDADALAYPALAERGREFLVRSSAQLMDEAELSRETVATLLQAEAQKLSEADKISQIMPSCLLLLDASGL